MTNRPTRRAATLVETLVAAGLLALTTALMVSVYLLGNRYLNKTQTQSRLQQQVSQGLYRVVRDLASSTDESEVLTTVAGSHAWFLGGRNDSGQFQFSPVTGQQVWDHWICYYKDDTVLRRSQVKLTSTDNFSPWTGLAPTPTLGLFQGGSVTSNQVVSEAVSDFRVNRSGVRLYRVDLTCRLQTSNGQFSDLHLWQEVFVHN